MRYWIKLYNNWHTENNEDEVADMQIQTESNNRKALLWAVATLVIGVIF